MEIWTIEPHLIWGQQASCGGAFVSAYSLIVAPYTQWLANLPSIQEKEKKKRGIIAHT